MSEVFYKVLNADATPCNGGSGKWNLPHGECPGKWMPKIENVKLCSRGYHLCRRKDLAHWLGPTIWIAEGRGKRLIDTDKVCFEQARLLAPVPTWNERTARLFACDCAERVLPIYRKHYPNDDRPEKCIAVARRFAEGKATREEFAATWAAAEAAWAVGTAWAVGDGRAAAWKWQTERLFEYLNGNI